MKLFDEIPVIERGHPKGIITDSLKGNSPDKSVYYSENFDFYEKFDERRKPLLVDKDYSSYLPANYKIIGFYNKVFTDYKGNTRDIRFICTKNPSNSSTELKIYADGYFCPQETAENAYKASEGFNSDIIELTERYSSADITFTAGSYTVDSKTYNLRTSNALFNKDDNYFKGFFYFNEDNEAAGIVNRSKKTTSGGNFEYHYFNIDLNADFEISADCFLARFPVNCYNKDKWKDIDKVEFIDSQAGIKILCNNKAPILSIDFLNNRKYFGGLGIGTITGDLNSYDTVTGLYTGDEEVTFEIKVSQKYTIASIPIIYVIELQWRAGSTDTWKVLYFKSQLTTSFDTGVLSLPNNIYVKLVFAYADVDIDDKLYIPIEYSDNNLYWNGFYFGYNTPYIENKKEYLFYQYNTENPDIIPEGNISKYLGVSYKVTPHHNTVSGSELRAKIYSLALQFNGSEIIFLKNIVSAPSSDVSDRNCTLDLSLRLSKTFDRRISAHLLFFQEYEYQLVGYDNDYSHNNSLPPTHLLDDISKGINQLSKSSVTLDNNYYLLPIVAYDESTDKTLTKSHAKGNSLLTYLNQYYYNEITVNGSKAIVIDKSLMLYDINIDNLPLYDGKIISDKSCYVCLANIQKGIIEANRNFSVERTIQLTNGESILAIAPLISTQFLVLTNKTCSIYDIKDISKAVFQKVRDLELQGIINYKSLVVAKIKSQFGGVFWINYSGIYRYYDNKIVNLVKKNLIETLFRTFTDNEISNAIGYFHPQNKQVFFYISDKVLIYNLEGDHFKIYKYPVTPEFFSNNTDGDILFSNGQKIYIQARNNSTAYLDLSTTGITGEIHKYYDLDNPAAYKIPHSLRLNTEGVFTTNEESGPFEDCYLTVKGSTNDNNSDVLDKDLLISDKPQFDIIFPVRKTGKYSLVKFIIKQSTSSKLKSLKINFVNMILKVTGKYNG